MASDVSICNQALSWLGQRPIISLNDPSTTAQLCKANYELLRDAVLESHSWTFALGSVKLESTQLNEFGTEHVYPIDNEWLHILHVYRDIPNGGNYGGNFSQANWHIEGQKIVAKETVLFVEFIKRVKAPNQFSSLFIQALSARLAADLAVPVTENRKLQADMWALYENKLEEAVARDGMQGRSEVVRSKRVLNARSRSF